MSTVGPESFTVLGAFLFLDPDPMFDFNSTAYEPFAAKNPALHELLISAGAVIPPPPPSPLAQVKAKAAKVKRVQTPLKTLTAIQATLNADPSYATNETIQVSFKLYNVRQFDFNAPCQQFTVPVKLTGGKFVGAKHGYTVEAFGDDELTLFDGVDTIILPEIREEFSAGSHAKKATTFLGQSRADLTGSRRDWPTGQARFA